MSSKIVNNFIITISEQDLQAEKRKASTLKKTQWWKRKLSKKMCFYCSKEFPLSQLTMDHIVPIIRGGKTAKSNVVVACKICNSAKKYLLPTEWEDYLNKLKEN
jgi:5-methylcytosine-specific restriction endonuclease McrA